MTASNSLVILLFSFEVMNVIDQTYFVGQNSAEHYCAAGSTFPIISSTFGCLFL